jgi:hypothetical protein
MKRRILIGIASLFLVGGLAACGTKTTSGGSKPATPVASTNNSGSYSDSTVNAAIKIQAAVCTLIGQGYTQGQIIDAVAQYGYTGSTVAGIVAAAAANCA